MDERDNCIFCKIIDGKIPAGKVSEDDYSISIKDVNPQAPTHILVIPKNHFANLTEVEDKEMLGNLFMHVQRIVKSEKLNNGFRAVVNTGVEGGQTVDHLHIHVLAGRSLGWPPG